MRLFSTPKVAFETKFSFKTFLSSLLLPVQFSNNSCTTSLMYSPIFYDNDARVSPIIWKYGMSLGQDCRWTILSLLFSDFSKGAAAYSSFTVGLPAQTSLCRQERACGWENRVLCKPIYEACAIVDLPKIIPCGKLVACGRVSSCLCSFSKQFIKEFIELYESCQSLWKVRKNTNKKWSI